MNLKRYDVTERQFEFASVKATVTGTVSKVDALILDNIYNKETF